MTSKSLLFGSIAALGVSALAAQAQQARFSYSSYGVPGLIDMPTALSAPDAELATSMFSFGDVTKVTLAFQLSERLNASFRYSRINNWSTTTGEETFDRSFDIHYRFVDEGKYRPAIAIGLQDFIGTGIYSSEYIVATKHLTPRLTFTGGIGWGRLGSYNGFTNPLGVFDSGFESRPGRKVGSQGGDIKANSFFRGDAAFFGGVAWQATNDLQLKLEYSSDAYVAETARNIIDRKSPLNFGIDYKINDLYSVQAFYLYGSTVGAMFTILNQPKASVAPSGLLGGPIPVRARAPGSGRDLGWVNDGATARNASAATAKVLRADGMELESMRVEGTRVEVQIRNTRYDAEAEAIGRTARLLSQSMPDSVETFVIIPVVNGMTTSQVTLQRSDIEALEHDPNGSEQMLARAQIGEAPTRTGAAFDDTLYPRFRWGLGPYVQASYFDPDSPIRAESGLEFNAEFNIARGLYLETAVRKALAGNLDDSSRASDSVLPRVRSESNIYDREGDPSLEKLTLAYYFRPGNNLYGRVTAGYLEPQFGGLSAEVLWKPVGSPFALGAEMNLVKQRDFDQQFGFRDYEVATGHVSGYWQMKNGFHAQVDAGRYLAGDWGATFGLDRVFKNGWRVGAYATFTDVSFDDFGEGSFDKGLRFSIPLTPFIGQPTRRNFGTTLQPLTRDGGARLDVDGRLYETVRGFHANGIESSWGRFWR